MSIVHLFVVLLYTCKKTGVMSSSPQQDMSSSYLDLNSQSLTPAFRDSYPTSDSLPVVTKVTARLYMYFLEGEDDIRWWSKGMGSRRRLHFLSKRADDDCHQGCWPWGDRQACMTHKERVQLRVNLNTHTRTHTHTHTHTSHSHTTSLYNVHVELIIH